MKLDGSLFDTFSLPGKHERLRRGHAAHSREGIGFLALPDCTLRYRLAGSGSRTIVFCTDPPVPLEVYDELIAQLAPDFRVLVVEPPGFGFSLPRLGMDFTAESATRALIALLDHLRLGPAILAFPCVPAYIALLIAAQRPELVSALVLMQAPCWREELRWKQRRDPKNILGRPWIGQLLLRLLRRNRAGQWYALALGRRSLRVPFTEETLRGLDHGACFSLASAFQKFLTDDAPRFGPVRQPALVVWGDADRSHAQTDKDSIRELLPQAQILHWAQAGHFPELEAPREFAAAMRNFLRGSDVSA